MTTRDFELLKDFILSKNTYFDNGYANVFKDSDTKKIFTRSGNELVCVFPNDNLGNYFYLRNEAGIQYQPQLAERVTDSGPARLLFNDNVSVQLIAVVKDADAYVLLNNLRNTAMMYKEMNVIPASAIWLSEDVIVTEMAGSEAKDISAALQRIKNETIVRLTLTVSKQYIPNNCIVNSCKNC